MVAAENTRETGKQSWRRARERKREGDEVRERDDSPLWPCNYIQSLLRAARGGGPRRAPLIGQRRSRAGGVRGSDLSSMRQL